MTSITITVMCCVLLADFISGLVHWLEDSYGSSSWPIIGEHVILPNLIHHDRPRAFLSNGYWVSARISILIGLFIILHLVLLDSISWPILLTIFILINANEIHRMAHRSRAENGMLISWLQGKLIVSRSAHGRHHTGKRNTNYCSVIPYLNPILDKVKFWRCLEYSISKITGISPRDNS